MSEYGEDLQGYDDLEGEDMMGEDMMGDDEMIGLALRRGQRRRVMALGPKPPWRRGIITPGVNAPRDAREMLPLTPDRNNGLFDSTNGGINFVGRPQRPFQPLRLIANIRRSAGANGVAIRAATIIVGTDNNLVQISDFDLDTFAPTAVGVGLKLQQAVPGIEVRIPVQATPAVPVGESVACNLIFIGRSIQ